MTEKETWQAIQRHVGVTPDGIPGPKTASSIYKEFGLGSPPTPILSTRSIVDVAHHDAPLDIATMAKSGMNAIICKATQGISFKDSRFEEFKKAAKDAGVLFGSYHFGNSEDAFAQVAHYLEVANPAPNDLVCLDWEKNPSGASMTRSQARQFVQAIHDQRGFWPVIYGGSLLKEQIPSTGDDILNHCPLWLSQYSGTYSLPPGWKAVTLWQYRGAETPTGFPYEPHTFEGANGLIDCSQFDGTVDALKSAWPFRAP